VVVAAMEGSSSSVTSWCAGAVGTAKADLAVPMAPLALARDLHARWRCSSSLLMGAR
jgi:hypothetical protein